MEYHSRRRAQCKHAFGLQGALRLLRIMSLMLSKRPERREGLTHRVTSSSSRGVSALASLEPRLALFQERCQAFAVVPGFAGDLLQVRFVFERGLE